MITEQGPSFWSGSSLDIFTLIMALPLGDPFVSNLLGKHEYRIDLVGILITIWKYGFEEPRQNACWMNRVC